MKKWLSSCKYEMIKIKCKKIFNFKNYFKTNIPNDDAVTNEPILDIHNIRVLNQSKIFL